MRRRFARLVVAAAFIAACFVAAKLDWGWLRREAGAARAGSVATVALGAAAAAAHPRRKRAGPRVSAALIESNERLRLALAAGKMGTWTRELRSGGRVVLSPELEVINGLRPGEFPGTEAALFELIHPEDRELVVISLMPARLACRCLRSRSSLITSFLGSNS